jgi:hypothetical protein
VDDKRNNLASRIKVALGTLPILTLSLQLLVSSTAKWYVAKPPGRTRILRLDKIADELPIQHEDLTLAHVRSALLGQTHLCKDNVKRQSHFGVDSVALALSVNSEGRNGERSRFTFHVSHAKTQRRQGSVPNLRVLASWREEIIGKT